MSRAYCYRCQRAKVACLCGRIEKQANRIKVWVLQHPDEQKNPKGSAIIAELGLQHYACLRGEDFSRNPQLEQLLKASAGRIAIVYPHEQAQALETIRGAEVEPWPEHVIFIDATWRKATKIWQLNPQLHGLPVIKLAQQGHSQYRIRKQPMPGYVSTLEAIVGTLRQLERQAQAYQPLLDLFGEMVDFQIQHMGNEVYGKNYRK